MTKRRWLFAATGLLALVHVWFAFHVGALWRDEANAAAFATMSPRDLWTHIRYDTYPLLATGVFRAWAFVAGDSDLGWRILGATIGCCIVAALWMASRALGTQPVFSLPLVGFSPSVVRWGDSLRPTGLAALWIVLLTGALWRAIGSSNRRWVLAASIFAIAAVQTLYQASVIVAALSLAAALVATRDRAPGRALLAILPGIVAALSLLADLPLLEESLAFAGGMRHNTADANIVGALADAMRPAAPIWGVAVFLSAAGMARGVGRGIPKLQLYGMTVLLFSTLFYFVFLVALHFPTQPWYFLVLLVACGLGLDAMVSGGHPPFIRATVYLAWLAVPLGLIALRARNTNVDEVARRLQALTGPKDRVVVVPWVLGVSFSRYYRGSASWQTAPPIVDHRIHRYDLASGAILPDSVVRQLQETLAAGGKVWWVTMVPDLILREVDASAQMISLARHPVTIYENIQLFRSAPSP